MSQPLRTRGASPEKTAQTRAKIMRAALEAFIEKGYERSSISDIAARAEIAKGTCYRYFSTKEHLFEQVLAEAVVEPLSALNAYNPQANQTVIAFLMQALLPFMRAFQNTERALIARLVLVEGERFPAIAAQYAQHVYHPFNAMVQRSARLALERGELRNSDLVDYPELLAAPIWIGIVHNHILSPQRPIDIGKLFEIQLETFFRR